MVESGPASGFWGAAELGRLIGEPNVLALDIGGTTAKCSLIEGGHVKVVSDYWIERSRLSAGYPVLVPVVDVVEIGNGGGSIAWVDDFGKLHVGPQSAGALPGPAAYGRGGTEPTTTDAFLALGRINPAYFCGGEIEADMAAVERALCGARAEARHVGRRGGRGRRPDREQQHDQRAQARLAQPRLRPARLHARRLRRRRRHARRRARRGARHPQGRRSARGRRLLGLGDADERSAPRLLRDAARHARAGQCRPDRRAARRDRRHGARAVRARRRRRGAGRASSATASCATKTRSTASRCCSRTAGSTQGPSPRSPSASTTPTSASTPTASPRRSSSSARTS